MPIYANGGIRFNIEVDQEDLDDIINRFFAVGDYSARPADWGRIVADEIRNALDKATDTWNHQPDFRIDVLADSVGQARLRVSTDDKPFIYVNEGTRPHRIAAKNGKALAFHTGFSPKTSPGRLQSGTGYIGGPMAFPKEVWHPGTEGRHFDKLAVEYAEKEGMARITKQLKTRWERYHGEW